MLILLKNLISIKKFKDSKYTSFLSFLYLSINILDASNKDEFKSIGNDFRFSENFITLPGVEIDKKSCVK